MMMTMMISRYTHGAGWHAYPVVLYKLTHQKEKQQQNSNTVRSGESTWTGPRGQKPFQRPFSDKQKRYRPNVFEQFQGLALRKDTTQKVIAQ